MHDLRVSLIFPEVSTLSSNEQVTLVARIQHDFQEPITIGTVASGLGGLIALTKLVEKESGITPFRGWGASGNFKNWKLAFSPQNAHRHMTLYPGQPQAIDYQFRHRCSVPDPGTIWSKSSVDGPTRGPNTMSMVDSQLEIRGSIEVGKTYTLRVRTNSSKDVPWIRGTKEELLDRYLEISDTLVSRKPGTMIIPYDQPRLNLTGTNEVEFVVKE